MKHTCTLTLLLWLLVPNLLIAQRIPLALTTLETPHLKARISNSADHFGDFVNRAGLEAPAGSGRHTQFAHSMWIGGLDPSGQLHLAAQTYRQSGIDFFTGVCAAEPGGCDREGV
jgi:hypothetical protein